MSIRVYIKPGAHIKTNPGLGHALNIAVHGQFVADGGTSSPYVFLSSELPFIEELPADLAAVMTSISYQGAFDSLGKRIRGEYCWKTARAVIVDEPHKKNDGWTRQLTITAKTIADLSEAYSLIRGGKLHPSVSYEEPMVPTPARHVRQLLREIGEVIRRDITVWWTGAKEDFFRPMNR